MRPNNYRLNIAYNERRPCSLTGCPKHRKALSRYCDTHARTSGCYGHPLGHLIAKQKYAGHVKMARRILKRLEGHPALIASLDVVRGLLERGEEPTKPRPLRTNARWLLWREMTRLDDVTPQEVLATVVGVWLFSHFQPRVLPSDARLTFMLGQAVLRLRPLAVIESHYDPSTGKVDNDYRPPPGRAVGLIGGRVRRLLSPFFANICVLVEKEHQENAARAAALRTPLSA